MITLIEILILSVIQGITEWFPVSSSGHLALMQFFFGSQDLAFDVFLHFASILSVIVIFWRDIFKLFENRDWRYMGLLVLAVIPAFLFGMLLREYIVESFNNLFFIGLFFIFSGVIICLTRFSNSKRDKVRGVDALFIGLLQVFALFPGISRSGMTISGGLFAGLKKEEAIKFSFLLSIPVILGASLAEAGQVFSSGINYWILLFSFVVTFLVSLATIRLLLSVIKSEKFWWFGIYDIVLGVVVLGWRLV